jgi:hypothetical protein
MCRGRCWSNVSPSHERLVRLKLRAELILGKHAILDARTLILRKPLPRSRDRACWKAELLLFAAFVVCDVRSGYTLHAEDLDFITVATR